jgi:hypothetical protein
MSNSKPAGAEGAKGPQGRGAGNNADTAADPKAAAARANQVKFDTSALKSTYCNVCNGSSTRE